MGPAVDAEIEMIEYRRAGALVVWASTAWSSRKGGLGAMKYRNASSAVPPIMIAWDVAGQMYPSLPIVRSDSSNTHKLALLNRFNSGRQPAPWKWCPQHQARLDLFTHLAYPVEFAYHPLPMIPFPAT